MTAVTVLGTGYAGVMAANRLAGRGVKVTAITTSDRFVERIRLHTVASGHRTDATVPLSTVLHADVRVVVDPAVRMDVDARVLHLASGDEHRYDTLIYAIGSGADDGAHGHHITTSAGAAAVRDALASQPDAPVTVVGAGLTGVELATALVAAGRTVRVVTRSAMTTRSERALVTSMRRAGIDVRTDTDFVDDGTTIVVRATGLSVPRLAADAGLPVDARGRLIVGPDLSVVGHQEIRGAGDAAVITDAASGHLRAACATALPMGAHAADTVHAVSEGRRPAPFRLHYVVRCTDLGDGRGHIQLLHGDDTDRPIAITGRAGGMVKEAVCRMTLTWLRQERDRAGRYSWAGAARA